jgi:hypothetical protein
VIADLSVHYVEGIVLSEGHTVQRTERDYGYDLLLFTYDKDGYVEPRFVMLQVKASESLRVTNKGYAFDLDIRDYNLWMSERAPVILILYHAARRRAYWEHVQDYFRRDGGSGPRRGARTVRIRVPVRQILSRKAIARMRRIKGSPQLRLVGGEA